MARNIHYHNVVLAVERFVVQTGAVVTKVFGKDSIQAREWSNQKKELLKGNLSFGFCLEERHHIEHVMKPLAIINLNPTSLLGGIGVNLESDYSEYDRRKLPAEYRSLRDGFLRKRIAQGRRPFLSISGMLPSIQMAVMVLYFTALEFFEECLRGRVEKAMLIGEQHDSNGLLIIPKWPESPSYHEPRRILRWGFLKEVEVFERQCQRVKEFIDGVNDDIDRLKRPAAHEVILF